MSTPYTLHCKEYEDLSDHNEYPRSPADIPLLHGPITAEEQARIDQEERRKAREKSEDAFKERQITATEASNNLARKNFYLTCATILIAAVACGATWYQGHLIRKSWQTSQDTLQQMRTASEESSRQFQVQLQHFDVGLGRTEILAEHAGEQADAAKNANGIAKIASESVQRAFITVDQLETLKKMSPDGRIDVWITNPVVTNSGTTPTRNLYFQISFGDAEVFNWPPDKEPPFDPPSFPTLKVIRAHKNWQQAVLAPHASVTNLTVLNGFGASGLDDRKNGPNWGNTGEYVFGAFVYGDVFNPKAQHVTEFCFVLERPSMAGNQFLPYQRCNHHNCADAECNARSQ